jgi:hypothetical protein
MTLFSIFVIRETISSITFRSNSHLSISFSLQYLIMLLGIVVPKDAKFEESLLAMVISQRTWTMEMYLEMMHAVIINSIQMMRTLFQCNPPFPDPY